MTRDDVERQLEQLIDQSSIRIVLESLALVCRDKARHVEEKDMRLAENWDWVAEHMLDAADYNSVKELSGGDEI